MTTYSDEHWQKVTDCVLGAVNKAKEAKVAEAQDAIATAEAKAIQALQEKDRNKRLALDQEATRLGSIANQKLNDANAFGNQVGDMFEVLRACVADGLLDRTEKEVDGLIAADAAATKARQIELLEAELAKLKA